MGKQEKQQPEDIGPNQMRKILEYFQKHGGPPPQRDPGIKEDREHMEALLTRRAVLLAAYGYDIPPDLAEFEFTEKATDAALQKCIGDLGYDQSPPGKRGTIIVQKMIEGWKSGNPPRIDALAGATTSTVQSFEKLEKVFLEHFMHINRALEFLEEDGLIRRVDSPDSPAEDE